MGVAGARAYVRARTVPARGRGRSGVGRRRGRDLINLMSDGRKVRRGARAVVKLTSPGQPVFR